MEMRISLGLVVALAATAMTLGRESRAENMNADPVLCAAAVAEFQRQFRTGNYSKPDPADVALYRKRMAALERDASGPAIARLATEFNARVGRLQFGRIARLRTRHGGFTERFWVDLGEYLIRTMNDGRSTRVVESYRDPRSGQGMRMEIRAGSWSVNGVWSAEVSACAVLEGPGTSSVEGCSSLSDLDGMRAYYTGDTRLRRIFAEEIRDNLIAAVPEPKPPYDHEADFIAAKLEEAHLWCPNYTLMSELESGEDHRLAEGGRAVPVPVEPSRCESCCPNAEIGI